MTDKDPTSNPLYVHPADTNVLSLVTTPLNGYGDDYGCWKRSMLISLCAKNKIGFINGDLVRPTTNALKISQWDRCNDIVISWIFGSVSEEIKASVVFTETAKGIWEELEDRFEHYNGARLYQLQDSLNQISQGSDSISTYLTNLKICWEEIRSIRIRTMPKCTCGAYKNIIKHEEDGRVMKFLMGLNNSYNAIRGQILMLDPIPDINGVYSLLIQAEKQREIEISTSSLEASAMPTKGWNNTYKNPKYVAPFRRNNYHCTHCNVDGHSDSRCCVLHPQLRGNRRMAATTATVNKQSEHGESSGSQSNAEYDQILQELSKFNLKSSKSSELALMAGDKVRDIGSSNVSEISETSGTIIKILSYNVWFRDELEGHLRMQAIGNLIQLHSPHVICFQEVNSVLYDIFQRSSWWKKYRCSVSFERSQNESYFCMQLAKIPVKSFSRRPFSYTMMCRELCVTQLELNNNKSLVIATSHLESPSPGPPTWDQMFSKERVNQAKEAVTFLQQFLGTTMLRSMFLICLKRIPKVN